jgi:hypothetical protein
VISSRAIEDLAGGAYATGADPLSVALAVTEIITEETLDLECRDPRVRLLARRVVGALLDCGWQAPARTETQ